MAVKRVKSQLAYGLTDSLITLAPTPIVGVRNPAGSDRAEIGTMWVNKANNTVYVITSIVADVSTWTIVS